MKQKFIKSPLNYTGGKYKLLPQIMPLFPDGRIRRFVDMFAGGCNVSVNVRNADMVIANDINESVIGIYRSFSSMQVEEVIARIEDRISEFSLTLDNQDGYNALRRMYNESAAKDPIDLFVLICYSFNHQIRFNGKGEYNMPFGKNRSQFNDTIRKNLIDFHGRLGDIVFTTKSFDEIKVGNLSTEDFVYCDPPYLITCATYNEKDGWNVDKERRLLSILDEIDGRGVRFALSNVLTNKGASNDILCEWCGKYNVHHLSNTYSNCSYHAKDRDSTTTDEVLVTNY